MQNDIVRRPVVRPPARQNEEVQEAVVAEEMSLQPRQKPQEAPQKQAKPADFQPQNSHTESHEIVQQSNEAKKPGHGLAIATAVFIFIGLATTAVYLEINSDKPTPQNPQPTVTTQPQSFPSQQNDTSSITVQP